MFDAIGDRVETCMTYCNFDSHISYLKTSGRKSIDNEDFDENTNVIIKMFGHPRKNKEALAFDYIDIWPCDQMIVFLFFLYNLRFVNLGWNK